MPSLLRPRSAFHLVASGVVPDAKRRVSLGKSSLPSGVTYNVHCNDAGQILLDPQVSVPASEAWVFQKPEFLASLRRGMAQVAAGEVHDLGSFAEFAEESEATFSRPARRPRKSVSRA